MIHGHVYILECANGSYDVGSHRGDDPQRRAAEHNAGRNPRAYTFRRRPVELVWSDYFSRYDDMVACERQIKGWSRAKKQALIDGDVSLLKRLASRAGD
ncbi:MAG: GIY-YIG nuclease family protein [Pseudomonadota bacterium]